MIAYIMKFIAELKENMISSIISWLIILNKNKIIKKEENKEKIMSKVNYR